MAQMNVTFHLHTGEGIECEVPDDQAMDVLLPVLAERIGQELGNEELSKTSALELRNKTPGKNFKYLPKDTLAGRKTESTDTLVLLRGFDGGAS
jgi:hypothetical protein